MNLFFDITERIYTFMTDFYELLTWSYEINLGGDIGTIEVSILGTLGITFIIGVIIAKLIALVIPN